MEQWKPISLIPGFEEYTNYEMSIDGTLRRTVACANTKAGHTHKWVVDDGYLHCNVSCKGKTKKLRQHRAIAYLFIDNPNGYDMVDHINRDRSDNRIENLRWCTKTENRHNSNAQKNNKSGFKNIYKACDKFERYYWRVEIDISGKKNTKSFRCEPDATEPPIEVIECRDQMVKQLHGEFAVSH